MRASDRLICIIKPNWLIVFSPLPWFTTYCAQCISYRCISTDKTTALSHWIFIEPAASEYPSRHHHIELREMVFGSHKKSQPRLTEAKWTPRNVKSALIFLFIIEMSFDLIGVLLKILFHCGRLTDFYCFSFTRPKMWTNQSTVRMKVRFSVRNQSTFWRKKNDTHKNQTAKKISIFTKCEIRNTHTKKVWRLSPLSLLTSDASQIITQHIWAAIVTSTINNVAGPWKKKTSRVLCLDECEGSTLRWWKPSRKVSHII